MSEPAFLQPARTAPESQAKPKVMRRPSQFSSATPAKIQAPTPVVEPMLFAPLTPAQPAVTTIHEPSPWQNDGRFALALLVIVLVVNVTLYYALRQLAPAATQTVLVQSATAATGAVNILDDSKSTVITTTSEQ